MDIPIIKKSLRTFLGHSFQLSRSNDNAFVYTIEGKSWALNRFPNESKKVKVLEWFDDFWLFLEIRFKVEDKKNGRRKESQTNTFISLSVFQGKDSDDEKYQLFRAEWDDHNNPDEKHAQPHWHITSSQAIENTLVKYAEEFDQQEFLQMLESEKQKVLDVKKIHFAMNADWQTNETHLHKMDDEQQIVNWLQGMLNYLRIELEVNFKSQFG